MIRYDSDVCEQIVSNFGEAGTTLNSDIAGRILSDYSALTSVGLFSSQLNSIKSSVTNLVNSYNSFTAIISESRNAWGEVQNDSMDAITEFDNQVDEVDQITTGRSGRSNESNFSGSYSGGSSSGGSYSGGSYSGSSSSSTSSSSSPSLVENVYKGKEISNNDVKELLVKVNSSLLPILIQKINKLANGEDLTKLFTDSTKSNTLTAILKKILGDTSTAAVQADLDTETIQKMILSKLNTNNVDINTEEGKSAINRAMLEQLNTNVDESVWNVALYGDNTVKVETLGGTWVCAKTAQDLGDYLSYVEENGVKQDANTAEWNDSCLAFAGAHAYDLYSGSQTSGPDAANYAHAQHFTDYINDSKEETLSKIYDEIMSGRPVVLQVNGNKAGTSRHFATVVGFKEGVVSGATLKESDLLIIDSWDGKIESMDTESSRFMTTGAACNKDYSGYRLRVLNS